MLIGTQLSPSVSDDSSLYQAEIKLASTPMVLQAVSQWRDDFRAFTRDTLCLRPRADFSREDQEISTRWKR